MLGIQVLFSRLYAASYDIQGTLWNVHFIVTKIKQRIPVSVLNEIKYLKHLGKVANQRYIIFLSTTLRGRIIFNLQIRKLRLRWKK